MGLDKEYAYAVKREEEYTAAAIVAETEGKCALDMWERAQHYHRSAERLMRAWETEVHDEIWLLTHYPGGNLRYHQTGTA